jgi:hypothetical protein
MIRAILSSHLTSSITVYTSRYRSSTLRSYTLASRLSDYYDVELVCWVHKGQCPAVDVSAPSFMSHSQVRHLLLQSSLRAVAEQVHSKPNIPAGVRLLGYTHIAARFSERSLHTNPLLWHLSASRSQLLQRELTGVTASGVRAISWSGKLCNPLYRGSTFCGTEDAVK